MRTELSPSTGTRRRRNVYAVLLGVTLVAIALVLYNSFDEFRPQMRTQATPVPPALTVAVWNNRLQLKWDPANEAIRQAQRADVVVSDGGREERIALTPEALRNGNMIYTPQTDDVTFRLQTYGPLAQTASVRLIGARGAAASDQVAQTKPDPFGANPVQVGTADRALPAASTTPRRRIVPVHAVEPPQPAHRGVLTRMKHGFAKLWPLRHRTGEGGER